MWTLGETLHHLLDRLSAELDAAIDAHEQAAAWDLADSLRHGGPLRDRLERARHRVWVRDLSATITTVAADHVEADDLLVPLDRLIVRPEPGPPPEVSPVTWLARLRGLAHSGPVITVFHDGGRCRGRALCVGDGFVEVGGGAGSWLVPCGAIAAIRLSPGD